MTYKIKENSDFTYEFTINEIYYIYLIKYTYITLSKRLTKNVNNKDKL